MPVLVTAGLYLLLGLEWNLTTIAAFLTLIGYSVNDTVVTFDRVRENRRRNPAMPLGELPVAFDEPRDPVAGRELDGLHRHQ